MPAELTVEYKISAFSGSPGLIRQMHSAIFPLAD